MKAVIITIGDEILIGQIVDTNSAWLGAELQLLGIPLLETRSISDDLHAILRSVDEAFELADVIIMTGGLGPTKDDMTKVALAKYFNCGMNFHERTWEKILKFSEKIGREPTSAHRQQCYMPDAAEILRNNMGSAPGMLFRKAGKILISMPGVPYEMKWIFEHELKPILAPLAPTNAIAHQTILTVGEGESRIALRIEDIEADLPANIKLAFLPGLNSVRLRLSAFGNDQMTVDRQVETKKQEILDRIPELVFGFEKEVLAAKIGELLVARNLTMGVAESCTGGYVGHLITANSGSSAYFNGGLITYSNELKHKLLGVQWDTLKAHGAVSEQCVREMVLGAVDALSVDLAISISGIAGPSGGTPEKPVGTIWMAAGSKDRVITRKISLFKDRGINIQYAAISALNLLRKFLLEAE